MNSPRKDSLSKVLGTTEYSDDIDIGSYLYGCRVGVPVSKGILRKINFDPSYDWSNFVVCTAKDLRKEQLLPPKTSDEPIILDKEVSYYGQPAVLLAHQNYHQLAEAAKHISFDYTAQTPSLKIDIDEHHNKIFSSKILSVGDADSATSDSDTVIEGTYSTQPQEHMYLETQIVIASHDVQNNVLYVEGSMQAPFNVREALIRSFQNRVKEIVVTPHISGGAFGGREDFATQIALQASLLAIKSGKKIKLKLDRRHDMLYSTKRHPSVTTVKVGIKNNKINSLAVDFYLDGGAYETISTIVLCRAMLHPGSFYSPNIKIVGKAIQTNTPPNGAFRGFGAPQIFFAVESHLDFCIKKLKMNEIEFRRKNLLTAQNLSLSGQTLGEPGVNKVFAELLDFCDYEKLRRDIEIFNQSHRGVRRGLGIASVFHGTGYTGHQDIDTPVSVRLNLYPDGHVEIESSVVEFGQGSHTMLPQIAASVLHISPDRISVKNLNTKQTPSSGATVASRTATMLGNLVTKASFKLLEKINSGESVSVTENYTRDHAFDYDTLQGHAYENYASSSMISVVDIDLSTYEVKVKNVYITLDSGKIISHSNAEGQVQGGILQGIGFALYEEMILGDHGYENEDVSHYDTPTSQESPDIHIKFIETNYTESKGLGEIPVGGVAPSIANAIEDALGVRFTTLPITPEKIQKALQ